MAKRGALNDLNHDNWDKEDEHEEAGEFKKASNEQMKGRVIRKAKRKLTEDNKKNVFAGFGGFTSSNKSASDIFGFLAPQAKQEETSKPTNESNADDKKEVNGSNKDDKDEGFESKTSSEIEKNSNVTSLSVDSVKDKSVEDPFMAKFKTSGNNWSCQVCMVSNTSDKVKCLACETPNPKTNTKSDSLMNQFKTSNWSCEVCMVSNPSDKVKCLACETSNPKTEVKDDPLMAKFKSSTANWSCGVCMVSNPSDKMKCLACETPNPKVPASQTESKTVSSMTFGKCGGFKFGSASETPSSTSSFSFGSSTETTTQSSGFKLGSSTSETSSTGFKFGVSSEEKAKPVSGGFSFGSSKIDTAESGSAGFKSKPDSPFAGFNFGGSSVSDKDSSGGKSESVFGAFNMVSKPVDDKVEKANFKFGGVNPEVKEGSSGFKFGSSERTENAKNDSIFGEITNDKKAVKDEETGFKFGHSNNADNVFKSSPGNYKFGMKTSLDSAPETPRAKRGEYLASLKGLNIQVTNWIRSHVDENPLIDLTPVFKDYQNHITELKKKYNDENINKISVEEGAKEGKSEDKEEQLKMSSVEPKPFSFGLSSGTTSSTFGQTDMSSIKFGGFGNAFKFGSGQGKSDDNKLEEPTEEESEPAETAEPIEETDSLYTKKCKLFYKKGEAYIERGLGYIHLKRMEDGRLQVVIRADTSLGNILLNIVMSESIAVQRQGKNNVLMVCVPNPPLDPKDDLVPIPFLIRVKTEEDADELKEKLSDLMKPSSDEQ